MGAPYIEDAPAEVGETRLTQIAPLNGKSQWNTGKRVTLSVLMLFVTSGVAYAAYRLTSTEIPKSGTEKSCVDSGMLFTLPGCTWVSANVK